ncbi:Predicted membrane-bound metal-dependent hydrolase family protein [Verrucomicrobiia bacterium DG1235]|nr:Predicted membrane-bound metal-dependent hydrolase family protein [Verrucomicrobiae bacterium DG1235]
MLFKNRRLPLSRFTLLHSQFTLPPMDPISQGVLGSIAALTFAKPTHTRLAALAGCIGGMLADADILISSESDPLLSIEYHRHFSHSLAFIPIGGLIAAALLYPFLRNSLSKANLYLYCTAGYATAGLLDACTSYGTQLLWPFSDLRISWSIISIIDPVFTLPLLILLGLAVFKRSPRFARIASIFALSYLSFGILQNHRASSHLQELVASRGHHTATRLTVKPSIANLILWRSIYLHEGTFYVDALRVGFFSSNRTYPGQSIPAFDTKAKIAELTHDNPLAKDLARFNHFSEGYLAQLPSEPNFIIDLRYSAIPNSINPLWGIDLSDTTESGHAAFETRRKIPEADRKAFVHMLKGEQSLPQIPEG